MEIRRTIERARHSSVQNEAILPRRAASTVARLAGMEAAVALRLSFAPDFVLRDTIARGRHMTLFLAPSIRMRRRVVCRVRNVRIVQHTQLTQQPPAERVGAAVKNEYRRIKEDENAKVMTWRDVRYVCGF